MVANRCFRGYYFAISLKFIYLLTVNFFVVIKNNKRRGVDYWLNMYNSMAGEFG